MKNLPLKKRLVYALPAFLLLVTGELIAFRFLGILAIVYLLAVEIVLRFKFRKVDEVRGSDDE